MKKFIQGRWFPLVAMLTAVLVIALILFFCGFRITYAPDLESSWDAVSAVAAWVGVVISAISVIASFVAIWYAIQVPKKIADRQDKIALFEKRYDCFHFFSKCFSLCKMLVNNDTEEKVEKQCCHLLNIRSIDEFNDDIFLNKSAEFEYMLHPMSFLFSGIHESEIADLHESLLDVLVAIAKKTDIEKCKIKYIQAFAKFRDYADEIWDSVTISNVI